MIEEETTKNTPPEKSMQEQIYDELSSGEKMFLQIEEYIKGIMILLIALSLGSIYPFLALIFLFIGYFMLPTEYSPFKPEEFAGGIARFALGIYIPLTLFSIFQYQTVNYISVLTILPILIDLVGSFLSGSGLVAVVVAAAIALGLSWGVKFIPMSSIRSVVLIGGILLGAFAMYGMAQFGGFASQGVASMVFISAAFFSVLPESKSWLKSASYGIFSIIGEGLFSLFMLLAFYDMSNWAAGIASGDFWGGMGMVIAVIWFFGFLSGLLGGRSQRPYMGIIVLGMVVILFTYSFTGTVGVTLFGGFWGPVSQGIEAVGAPIGAAFDAAGNQMYCTQLFVTCPACYASDWRCQGGTPPTKAQSSTRAIELTNFQAINYLQGSSDLNPYIPLIGTIEIENKGDFTARNIDVEILPLRLKNPEQLSLQQGLDSAYSTHSGDNCYFTSCTASDVPPVIGETKCSWTDADGVVPGDIKLLSFRCGDSYQNYEHWSFYNDCVCVDPNTGDKTTLKCKCPDEDDDDYDKDCLDISSCSDGDGKTYEIISDIQKYVTIPVNYSYAYATNVTLSIDVMQTDVFEEKLLAREINIQEVESKYSGGPVALGLWTQKQPMRSGEPSFGRIFISNNGLGEVTGKAGDDIIIKIPQTGGLSISGIQFINNVGIKCRDTGKNEVGDQTIACDLTNNLKPSTDKDYKDLFAFFQFEYNIEDATIQEKSSLWRASFDYTYSVTDEITDMKISGTVY